MVEPFQARVFEQQISNYIGKDNCWKAAINRTGKALYATAAVAQKPFDKAMVCRKLAPDYRSSDRQTSAYRYFAKPLAASIDIESIGFVLFGVIPFVARKNAVGTDQNKPKTVLGRHLAEPVGKDRIDF